MVCWTVNLICKQAKKKWTGKSLNNIFSHCINPLSRQSQPPNTKLFSRYHLLLILCYQLIGSLQPSPTFTVQGTAQIYINDISWSYMWQRPSVTVYTWMWNYSPTESTGALSLISVELESHSRKLSHKKISWYVSLRSDRKTLSKWSVEHLIFIA